jgi:hypothetical protein
MATDDEIRYYQSLDADQKRNYTRRKARGLPLSEDPLPRDEFDVQPERSSSLAASLDRLRERGGHPVRAPAQSSPGGPEMRGTSRGTTRAAPGLGSQLLGAGKNWLENAAANLGGREPPHRAKSRAGRFLENASRNVGRMDMTVNPFGNPMAGLGGLNLPQGPILPPGFGMSPFGPAPRQEPHHKKKKKGKKHRREPEETRPWDPGHIPDGARDFF